MIVELIPHLVIVVLLVIVLRRKVFIIIVVIHLLVLGLLSRFLEVDVLATRAAAALNDVIGGDGFEVALALIFVCEEKY